MDQSTILKFCNTRLFKDLEKPNQYLDDLGTEFNKHTHITLDNKNVYDEFDLLNDRFQRVSGKIAPQESLKKERFKNPKWLG